LLLDFEGLLVFYRFGGYQPTIFMPTPAWLFKIQLVNPSEIPSIYEWIKHLGASAKGRKSW
jgi:hypothetical protein